MVDEGANYYVSAAVLGTALLAKAPALLRGWRSPTVRTVNALLLLPCAGFVLSAPPTVTAVNRLTGVSNLSALLVHCLMTAYACASLVLLDHWRGDSGDRARTRRRIRGWKAACCLVIVTLAGLFALGDVPVERPRDFDTYYAATPFIGAMLVLYLLAYVVAGAATAVMCWNWLLDIGGSTAHRTRTATDASLRVGLLVLVIAALANVVFGLFKLTAIAGRWAGRDWDVLNACLSPFISVSGMMVGVGLLVPAFGPGFIDRVWHPLRAVAALRPLWRLVRTPGTGPRSTMFLPPPWYAGPEQVLLYRMTTIHDWMLGLCGHCSDAVREQAHRHAERSGAARREAAAAGLAAMFRAAAEARTGGSPPAAERSARAVAAVRAAEAEDRELLVSISRALTAADARADTPVDARIEATTQAGGAPQPG
ncbi:MAB_1171c family putative transporter [Streptomyces sp. NPDC058662]|uniref:MAB_1171c family putative transporter n=1 Tax=Streptomyces sp. NPDC058662 TaxID=3346583 RepID=UPI003647A360